MSSLKKQFFQNIGSGWFAQLSTALVGFIMLPYNIQHLGNEVYGISVMAVSLVAMLEFLSLGMRPALLRFFSQALAKDDKDEFQTISSTSQLLLGGLGFVGAATILALIPVFLRFFQVEAPQQWATTILLTCLSGTFFLQFLSIVFHNTLSAANRYDLLNLNVIVVSWLRLLLLVAFYNFASPSLACLGCATIAATLFGTISTLLLGYREIGACVFFSMKRVKLNELPKILSFSVLTLFDGICFTASIQVPILIIGKILSKEEAALFAPGILIASCLGAFLCQIGIPLTPVAASDKIRNGGNNLGRWSILFGEIVVSVGCVCVLVSTVFMPDILRIWLGPDFVKICPVVVILLIGFAFAQSQTVNFSLAVGAGKIIYTVCSTIVMAILIITGTLLGTLYWGWGLWEIAMYSTIIRFLRGPIYLSWLYSQLFNYRLLEYHLRVYAKPIFCGFIMMTVVLLFKDRLFEFRPGLVVLLVEMSAVAFIHCICTWFIGLSGETRTFLLNREPL